MASLLNNASLLLNPAGSIISYQEDKIYSVLPRNGAGDFTFSGGDGGTHPRHIPKFRTFRIALATRVLLRTPLVTSCATKEALLVPCELREVVKKMVLCHGKSSSNTAQRCILPPRHYYTLCPLILH